MRKSTSTGKIIREIGELIRSEGWESWIAYSKGRDCDGRQYDDCVSRLIPVGSRISVILHGLLTRIFDAHGLGSRLATKRFVHRLRQLNPDIIHIHNIHGYFLNYKILFRYLASCGKPVIWTIHDCWLYTGHCYYYSAAACSRWQNGCGHCPQQRAFPASLVFDRSARNFKDKSAAFNSLPQDKLTIVPVSDWICSEMQRSFLSGARFKVIHNGIDTDAFKPTDAEPVRRKYALGGRNVIFGIASIWLPEKGFGDFVQISSMLNDDEVLVLVGKMTASQRASLPKSVITIMRTDNVHELAALYSAAVAFVNPTWQDNYPTVNMESVSCGTPVVTYRTGGSVESITSETGFIVEQGDVQGLLDRVRAIERAGKEAYCANCRAYALANFRKQDRNAEYIELYKSLIYGHTR